MLKELAHKTRSYRRFDEDHKLDRQTLMELIGLARVAASGGNLQPLKYILSWDAQTNDTIFSTLAWAGYLKDWPGPSKGERPTAYIIVLHDKELSKTPGIDHGIACQNILLGAVEKGLGGCMVASINREKLSKALDIADRYDIVMVVALGKPVERVVIDDIGPEADTKYYRDANQVHHVPKRRVEDLVLRTYP
jgi:nitroreductase